MQLLRSLERIKQADIQQAVGPDAAVGVTIGNFDGVHIGHRALFRALDTALEQHSADKRGVRVLMTFEPHPQRVLSGLSRRELQAEERYSQLNSFREKFELVREAGFDYLVAYRFTKEFSRVGPEDFIRSYLVEAFHPKVVVVGHDWSFGRGREGTTDSLRQFGKQYSFETSIVEPYLVDGERVSSGKVKDALLCGDLKRLERLLGRAYSLGGRVRHGDKRGRELGVPTANLAFSSQLLPAFGVYAARAKVRGKLYDAAVNVGIRPMFETPTPLVEVHLISDEDFDIYGDYISVEIVERLREEKKYSDIEALKDAMQQDIAQAKAILSGA